MRKISHWTPKYIRDRISLAWYEKQHPEAPWLTNTAISILSNYLKKTDIGIEWGAGRSTVWIGSRIQKLTSIESDLDWYQKVQLKIENLGLDNLDLKFINDQEKYVEAANLFTQNSLDFALIDGSPTSMRDLCAVNIVDKIKVGGCIVVDNANWFLPSNSNSPNSRSYEMGAASTKWDMFLEDVQDWRTIWTSNGVSDTAFFIKS